MNKKTERLVKAILKYQESKRTLILEYTGVNLIPEDVAMCAEDFDEDNLQKVVWQFAGLDMVGWSNCLHCLVYYNKNFTDYHHGSNLCASCPYYQKNIGCISTQVNPYVEVKKSLRALSPYRYKSFSAKLLRRGLAFEKEIKKYKETA